MHQFVSFNLEIINSNQARINPISGAVFYGAGVFTTIPIFNGRPFLWEKHWQRINQNALKLGIEIARFSENAVCTAVDEIVRHNKVNSGRARLTIFDQSRMELWPADSGLESALLISTADLRVFPSELNLTLSPYPVNSSSPLSNVKSANYMDHILALNEARSRGFDEAVRINERGEIVSACMANLFWIMGKEIFTPRLSTGALAGTTRDLIANWYHVTESSVSVEELSLAEGLFLTSAGLGVVPATGFGLQGVSALSLIRLIQSEFGAFAENYGIGNG